MATTDKPQKTFHPLIQPITPAVLEAEAAAQFVGLSRRTFEEEVRTGNAPKPRQLAKRRVGYLVNDLLAWLQSRPESSNLPPENAGYGRAGKPA